MNRQLINLDDEGKFTETDWLKDQWINTNRGIVYIIKDSNGNIIWEPYREGDFDFTSPFPKGYSPSVGETVLLPDNKARSCYKGVYTKGYEIYDSILLSSPYTAVRLLVVEERYNSGK